MNKLADIIPSTTKQNMKNMIVRKILELYHPFRLEGIDSVLLLGRATLVKSILNCDGIRFIGEFGGG